MGAQLRGPTWSSDDQKKTTLACKYLWFGLPALWEAWVSACVHVIINKQFLFEWRVLSSFEHVLRKDKDQDKPTQNTAKIKGNHKKRQKEEKKEQGKREDKEQGDTKEDTEQR